MPNVAFQAAHARFPRVVPDDVAHRLFRKFDLLGRDPVLVNLPRNQVLERDVNLLFLGVALQFDDLHAIAQRLRNRIEHVRRRNEQHLRQIERHIEIVIAERRVLLRIECFEQRRSRIAAEIAAHLVDFIEHEHRIFRLRAANALNDLSRQRPDIRPPVSANFRFIVHAAQRKPNKLAAQRSRNRLAQRSLAHARRSDKAQNRPLHVRLQPPHGKIVENPVFHLLQIVVIVHPEFPSPSRISIS